MTNKKLTSYDHYVPRTYLKHFSCKEKHVFGYRKKDLLQREMAIDSICGNKGGDILNFSNNLFFLREILKDIEKEWNIFIECCKNKNIIEKNYELIKEGNKKFLINISTLISYFLCLSPYIMSNENMAMMYLNMKRDTFKHEDMLLDKKLKEGLKLIDSGELIISIEQDDFYKYMGMKSLSSTALNIYNRRWIVLFNNTDIDFITSDTPAIHFTLDTPEHLMYQTQIYLPLTPKYALVIDAEHSPTIEYKEVTKKADVKAYNTQMVKFASDLVISSSENDGISKLVKKYRSYGPKIASQLIAKNRISRIIASKEHINID